MRYIILNGIGPILFNGDIDHSTIAYSINDLAYGEGNELVAGGEVEVRDSKHWDNGFSVKCSGRAIGIKDVKSRGVEDELLISKMFDKEENNADNK